MSKPKLLNCCGTTEIWFGPVQTAMRGNPKVAKRSRKVFHRRGNARFWHWYDQRHRLAEGYGP